MKLLILSIVALLQIINLSCKKDTNPVTPNVHFLDGKWTGRITYYFSDYPLSLTLNQVGNDSVTGQMVIGFPNPETTPIQSTLYFDNDSLHFTLNRGGFCFYQSMSGKVITADSLVGSWAYRCVNDPPMTSAWTSRRMQ